jgi:hypothetical protein
MADMATETSTATESGQDLRVEDKIKQPRELFADAPIPLLNGPGDKEKTMPELPAGAFRVIGAGGRDPRWLRRPVGW